MVARVTTTSPESEAKENSEIFTECAPSCEGESTLIIFIFLYIMST